jgi:hypothetical protein
MNKEKQQQQCGMWSATTTTTTTAEKLFVGNVSARKRNFVVTWLCLSENVSKILTTKYFSSIVIIHISLQKIGHVK